MNDRVQPQLQAREPDITIRRFILLIIGALLTFAVLAIGISLIGFYFWLQSTRCDQAGQCDKIEFESATWRNFQDRDDYVRIRMVDDLRKTYPLKGERRESIEELLGPPSSGESFIGLCDAVYWLGPERSSFSVDSEWLCLNYDNDLVVEHRLVTD
jgi:hypothetical protein